MHKDGLNIPSMPAILRKSIGLLNYFRFFQSISFYAPIALLYFQHITHSFALAASILSVALISAAIFEIPAGVYSDLIGRKKTIILGALSMTLAVVFYALADGYWLLVIGAILEGLSKAFYSGNNDAFLHNVLSQQDIQHEFHHYRGRLESIHMLGASGAALIGGFIAYWSFPLLIWLSVVPQVMCLAVTFHLTDLGRARREPQNVFRHLKEAILAMRKNYTMRMLSLANILDLSLGPSVSPASSGVSELLAIMGRRIWQGIGRLGGNTRNILERENN